MHLALKSAMSRIPYTNKVGETLSSIADPAAAYSLRALGGGDPMVARVRRSSDDAEKDFTASDMDSGSVADWVNGKQDTTLPCDVASAAAAYSLRSVNSNYTGSIVRVRRSSDDAEKDFSDVSLIANWVNEDVVITNATFVNINGTYDTFSGSSSSGFTATNTASDGRALSNLTISTPQIGDKFRINYNLTLNSGSGIKFLLATSTGSNASNSVDVTSSGTGSIELTANNLDIATLRINAIGNVDFVVSDISVTAIQSSGYVTTWYDQSGNGNNASQSTASSQPKIVDAGVLVSDGIEFDGVDDFLGGTDNGSLDTIRLGEFSCFGVAKLDSFNSYASLFNLSSSASNGGGALGFQFFRDSPVFGPHNTFVVAYDVANVNLTNVNNESLFTLIRDNSGTNGNGSSVAVYVKDNLGISFSNSATQVWSSNSGTNYYIGSQNNVGKWNGKISELIIYPSDQSANRFKIESNINNHYGLYTNDGFVTAWYDQSGNSNDATQSTAASQPKIVDAGVYLGKLDFDGVDDALIGSHNITSNYSFFSVTNDAGSATSYIADTGTNSNNGVNYGRTVNSSGNRQLTLNHGGFSALNATGFLVGESLISQTYDSTTISTSVNGASVGTTNQDYTASGTTLTIGSAATFGALFNGTMKEIISYNSDQSANRAAIETNINNYYDIY